MTQPGTDRDEVARRLVLRQLEAAMLGQPVDLARMRRILNDAGDDPLRPGSLAVLHGLIYAAAALTDEPGHDMTVALADVDRLAATVPADSDLAVVHRAVRIALLAGRAVDDNTHLGR